MSLETRSLETKSLATNGQQETRVGSIVKFLGCSGPSGQFNILGHLPSHQPRQYAVCRAPTGEGQQYLEIVHYVKKFTPDPTGKLWIIQEIRPICDRLYLIDHDCYGHVLNCDLIRAGYNTSQLYLYYFVEFRHDLYQTLDLTCESYGRDLTQIRAQISQLNAQLYDKECGYSDYLFKKYTY